MALVSQPSQDDDDCLLVARMDNSRVLASILKAISFREVRTYNCIKKQPCNTFCRRPLVSLAVMASRWRWSRPSVYKRVPSYSRLCSASSSTPPTIPQCLSSVSLHSLWVTNYLVRSYRMGFCLYLSDCFRALIVTESVGYRYVGIFMNMFSELILTVHNLS